MRDLAGRACPYVNNFQFAKGDERKQGKGIVVSEFFVDECISGGSGVDGGV